jgi:hypothetical protein
MGQAAIRRSTAKRQTEDTKHKPENAAPAASVQSGRLGDCNPNPMASACTT